VLGLIDQISQLKRVVLKIVKLVYVPQAIIVDVLEPAGPESVNVGVWGKAYSQ